jgi:hypothetical protein
MISLLTGGALKLDQWLQEKLGRPYNAILGVGLVIEIVRGLKELPHDMESRPRILGSALVLLMEVALLIHQVGALSHHFGRRRVGDHRARRGHGAPETAEPLAGAGPPDAPGGAMVKETLH